MPKSFNNKIILGSVVCNIYFYFQVLFPLGIWSIQYNNIRYFLKTVFLSTFNFNEVQGSSVENVNTRSLKLEFIFLAILLISLVKPN